MPRPAPPPPASADPAHCHLRILETGEARAWAGGWALAMVLSDSDLAAVIEQAGAALRRRLQAPAPNPQPKEGAMAFSLSARSRERLQGVHPDLVRVVERAIATTPLDFTVLEGLRSRARQAELFAKGATKTMNSRHLTGHAVDLGAYVAGEVRWDWPLYDKLAEAVKVAAAELGVPIEWGGDWTSFRDGPHWQLPWREYPA